MNKEDKNTFEVDVHEDMGLGELSPGGTTKKKKELEMSREEIVKKVLERKVVLSKNYVEPHNKKSRVVTNEDVLRVIKEAKILHEMCLVGRGIYTTAFALHHSQINDEDPLNFYVSIEGKIIINPEIVNHTNHLVDKKEGCMSFPEEPMVVIMRSHKIVLKYQTLTYKEKEGIPVTKPVLTEFITSGYSGEQAQIPQHEMEHALGHNIYEKDHNSSWCFNKITK